MNISEKPRLDSLNQRNSKRWIPVSIGLCVVGIGIALLAFSFIQTDRRLSRTERQSLAELEKQLTTRVTNPSHTSISGQIRSLIQKHDGKEAMQELDSVHDNLVFDAERQELYYTTLVSKEGERSKSKIKFIKSSQNGQDSISSSIGLYSGVKVVSLDIQNDTFEIVLQVDDNPGMHLTQEFGFEPSARYKKRIDLSMVRQRIETEIQPDDITDFENYSKIN